MKRKIFFVLLLTLMFVAGCTNMQYIDMTYKFDYAQISMPDGSVITGNLERWRDYDDCDMVQVVIDGITYYTHSSNVVMFTK